jgi:hypothetical protein
MNHFPFGFRCVVQLGLVLAGTGISAGQKMGSAGWTTIGPAVYHLFVQGTQVLPGPTVSFPPPPTDLPPEIRRAMMIFRASADVTIITNSTRIFDHYLPESLNNAVWINFTARTNGRDMQVWSVRSHASGWPAKAPNVQWNPHSLISGMKGMTALSPCWELEGSPGQVPITALTKRHGYARGHSMGADHVGANLAGKKVWFLTEQNKIVETTVAREVVRTRETSGRDYTILLFASDLPDTIQPMRVVAEKDVFGPSPTKYYQVLDAPCPLFKTEQAGYVSADVPGYTVNAYKGGDSGSPNMLPMPGELVFWSGRSTSSASPEMQADMDQLSASAGLDPGKYQLQWFDLSKYPTY